MWYVHVTTLRSLLRQRLDVWDRAHGNNSGWVDLNRTISEMTSIQHHNSYHRMRPVVMSFDVVKVCRGAESRHRPVQLA